MITGGCCCKDIHPVSSKKELAMNGEDDAIRLVLSFFKFNS